ncbi:hypothetical protein CNY89_16200 [Amaricoccus sp. HAR-UPW-R2A-40]|nr:hypothetical protein CNY89_16200 [Amaricoccus sp. HAR-UPW-R2A-40]
MPLGFLRHRLKRAALEPQERVHMPQALASVPDDMRSQVQERPVDGLGLEAAEFGSHGPKLADSGRWREGGAWCV